MLCWGCSVQQASAENAALRTLKQAKQAAEQEAEAAAKHAELAAAAADPWLNANANQAASALSPVRVRAAAATCGPAQHPGYGGRQTSCCWLQQLHAHAGSGLEHDSTVPDCNLLGMVCLWVVPACLLQVRKDHWKGMSAEQLAAIKHQQESQLEAKRAADAAAAAVEAAAIAESRNIQRAVLLQAQAAELVRRQQAAAVAAAQRDQVAAKATKDAQTNQLYANKVCLCEQVRVCWAAAKDTCMPHVCPLPLPCGSSTSISCLGCVPGYRAALWPSQHQW